MFSNSFSNRIRIVFNTKPQFRPRSFCTPTTPKVPVDLARRLRELTNAKLKDCKLALIENRFDMEKARQWIYYRNLNDKGTFKKSKVSPEEPSKEGFTFSKENILHPQPWRVLIIDIEEDVMEEEIETALHDACEKRPIHITEIEIFQDGYGDKKRTSAFISLISQEDLLTVLDENIRSFGIYIRGNRTSIKATDDRKTILFDTPLTMMLEEFLELLSPWGLEERDMNILLVTNNEGDKTGGIKITFNNHDIAYSIWSTFKRYPPKGIKAYWNQNQESIFGELSNSRDTLLEENISLRRKLEKMIANQETLYTKYNSQLNMARSEKKTENIANFEYHHALREHVEKVLTVAKYDRQEAAKLLGVTTRKLTLVINELNSFGHTVNIPEKF